MDHMNPQSVIEEGKSAAQFTEAEKESLLGVLGRFRTEILSKRILLKPGFNDFDRSKS